MTRALAALRAAAAAWLGSWREAIAAWRALPGEARALWAVTLDAALGSPSGRHQELPHLPGCDGSCGGQAAHCEHADDGGCPCCHPRHIPDLPAHEFPGDDAMAVPPPDGEDRDAFWEQHKAAAAALASVPGAGLDDAGEYDLGGGRLLPEVVPLTRGFVPLSSERLRGARIGGRA